MAYVVGAGAIIGLADAVLPAWEADPLVMKVLIVLALAGVPIAVFLAWAFDVVADPGPSATAGTSATTATTATTETTETTETAAVRTANDAVGAAGDGGAAGSSQPSGGPRHTLPTPATSFIGRDIERRELAGLLTDADCRLITVTGPGGVGKTRLALEAARESEAAFRHGIVYVPLSSVPSADLLVSALADAAGITVTRRDDPLADVLDFVREKQMLMVLDNFEHLMDGSSLLVKLIEAAPGLSLLVTSRERLRLTAETIMPLAGLPLSSNGRGRSDSAALFLNAARRLDRHFATDPDSAPQVQRICELLSGLPLAIELAAAWVRVLSCGEIVAELEKSLDLLSENAPRLSDRGLSLRATFDGSWRLLTEREQRVLAALSVFRAGFDREAAAHVAGADVTQLSSLLDKSLLARGDGMFMMIDVVRQYAGERLTAAPGAEPEARRAHADHHASLLQRLEPALLRADPVALAAVAAHIDDLRAAWRHATEMSDAGMLLRMMEGMFLFYDARGWAREGASSFELAQSNLEGLTDEDGEVPRCTARLRTRLGVFRYRLGEAGAVEELRRGVAAARGLGDRAEAAFALQRLGAALVSTGMYDEAERAHTEAWSLCMEIGDRHGIGWSLTHLGNAAMPRGRYDEAARLYEEALDLLTEEQDLQGRWVALNNLGAIGLLRKDYEEARRRLIAALELQQELGNQRSVATLRHNLGCIALEVGDNDDARHQLNEGLALSRQLGYQHGVAAALGALADLALKEGDIEGAGEILSSALKTAADARNYPIALEVLLGVARVHARTGDMARAAGLARLVIGHAATEHSTREQAVALLDSFGTSTESDAGSSLDDVIRDHLEHHSPLPPMRPT